jgi:uncharacterized protein (DUF952 family)
MADAVYKICGVEAWTEARRTGFFYGSPDDRRDGFIHLSTAAQLRDTLRKHFSTPDGQGFAGLLLVAFDARSLGAALKWEPSRGGALFPHLYGPLATGLAVSEVPLAVGADGRHLLNGNIAGC